MRVPLFSPCMPLSLGCQMEAYGRWVTEIVRIDGWCHLPIASISPSARTWAFACRAFGYSREMRSEEAREARKFLSTMRFGIVGIGGYLRSDQEQISRWDLNLITLLLREIKETSPDRGEIPFRNKFIAINSIGTRMLSRFTRKKIATQNNQVNLLEPYWRQARRRTRGDSPGERTQRVNGKSRKVVRAFSLISLWRL